MEQLTAWKESSKIVSLEVKIFVYPGRALFYTARIALDMVVLYVWALVQDTHQLPRHETSHSTHSTELPEMPNLPCKVPLIRLRYTESTLSANSFGSPGGDGRGRGRGWEKEGGDGRGRVRMGEGGGGGTGRELTYSTYYSMPIYTFYICEFNNALPGKLHRGSRLL